MPSDRASHTVEGNSRKRLKISRDASRPAGMSQTPEAPSLTSAVKQEPIEKTDATPVIKTEDHADGTPCLHEQSLISLNANLDSMRQLITCKICQRFLYEPYALTCGHTFCYSCLSSWLGDNRKKTCPDCRTVIRDEPSPSYLVREMVLIFVGKSELLTDGETPEDHKECVREEAEVVAKDRANTEPGTGGLFKGAFKRRHLVPLIAIRDQSDNVDRCPQCLHEIEDGRCNMCDVRVRRHDEDDDLDLSDDTDESEDLDYDLDDMDLPPGIAYYDNEDMYDGFSPDEEHPDMHYTITHRRHRPLWSDDESDVDEEDPSMDGFIDDEPVARPYNADVGEASDDTEVEVERTHRRRRTAPIIVSDDEDEDEDSEDEPQPVASRRRRQGPVSSPSSHGTEEPGATPSEVDVDDDDDDDDDEGPVPASQRSRHRPTTRVTVDITSDEEETDDESMLPNRNDLGGFSPPQYDLTGESAVEDEDEDEDHVENEYHDYGDDNSAISGHSERYTDHDEHDIGEEDSSDDGWGSGFPSALLQDQGLTLSAGISGFTNSAFSNVSHIGPEGLQPDDDDEPAWVPQPRHQARIAPTIRPASAYTRQLQPQPAARRSLRPTFATRPVAARPANPRFQPVRPAHPFNLDNTLARLRNETQRTTDRPSASSLGPRTLRDQHGMGGGHDDSSFLGQSSAGGVRLSSAESGSSGSSRTIGAGENDGSRRRRFAEMESEESDF